MKAIATKQPTNESVKQNKSGEKGRSRSISPLSTGMPLLQRKCACGGGCPRCKDELGIQTKLKISEPGDKYEQEADRIADEVMRMPEPTIHRQVELEEEEMVQRKAIANPITPLQRRSTDQDQPSEVPPIVHEVLRSPSQPLDPDTRAFMETRFGYDFSQVEVHTDAQASESARGVNALAYTVGRDVVFGAGQYAPRTSQGQKLLAHELTHVVQQAAGVAHTPETISEDNSPYEREAKQTADLISRSSQRVVVTQRHTPIQIARDNGRTSSTATSSNVSLVEISCGANTITFHTNAGIRTYELTSCDLSDGDYTARVTVSGNNVDFDLGETGSATRFDFSYRIAPGQPNPSTFFGSQASVHIVASSGFGTNDGGINVLAEVPIIFVADPLDLPFGIGRPSAISTISLAGAAGAEGSLGGTDQNLLSDLSGYPLTSIGLAGNVLASGDLSWLSSGDAARRVLSREYWSPFVPSRGNTMPLDRVLNELPRDLAPRIEAELAAGANRPLSWLRRGFTEAELRSIPDLVRRLNERGVSSLSAQEFTMLQRAAGIHGGLSGGSTPGAPFASYTRPSHPLPSWSESQYRVRVEMPRSAVLDLSAPNEFNQGLERLLNVDEAEFLATANHEGRLVSVQRMTGSGEASFLMRHSGKIRWGGRALFVVGLAVSAYRIANATPEERPVVFAEEGGGMAGGALGTGGAVAGCLLLGVATGGVGLFVCGLAGGIVGGALGSTIAGSVMRGLQEASPPCPSCHALQREWEANRSFSGLRSMGLLRTPNSNLSDDLPGSPAILTPEEISMVRRWLEENRSVTTP